MPFLEAMDAGIELVVCITECIPIHEMMDVTAYARAKGTRLIGPNCPGLISPGEAHVGILPGVIFTPGPSAWSLAVARLPTRSSTS